MRIPLKLALFGAAYHVGTILPSHLFPKFHRKNHGISNDVY